MNPLPDSLLARVAGLGDAAFLSLSAPRNSSRVSRTPHAERMRAVGPMRVPYEKDVFYTDPNAFFVPPAPIVPEQARVRAIEGGEVIDLSWPSAYEPFLDEVREAYLRPVENRTAHARLFTGPGPRPCAVLVHGFGAGRYGLEERAWPVRALFSLGLDVAIAVLPYHALRKGHRGFPRWPGADPRRNVEGFRQAIGDLRALVRWLRTRGATDVGVMGMSLGALTASLFATVEDKVAFLVPVIPLSSLAEHAHEQGRLGAGAQGDELKDALESVYRVVTPFARPSRISSDRVMIVAGEHDRVTPMRHALCLAEHFDAPLVRFPGAHLMQYGIAAAWRSVRRLLGGLGLTEAGSSH